MMEDLRRRLEYGLVFHLAQAKMLSEENPQFEEVAQLVEKALLKLKLIGKC